MMTYRIETYRIDLLRIAGVALLAAATMVSPAHADVTIEWVTVGNPGNAPDTLVMNKPNGVNPGDGTSGYGSVDYEFRISKHYVTNTQYVSYLNTVDPTGTNSLLYIANMTDTVIGGVSHPAYSGGILRDPGAPAGNRYSVKPGQGNLPAVHINWARAARYVNWLANGQGPGGTETGVYDMSVFATTSFATPPPRAENAQFFLPSEDEFYKAAYYDPTKNAGSGGYWQYGTRSDSIPASVAPPGTSNSANMGAGTTGAAGGAVASTMATTGAAFDRDVIYLTNVGAYTMAASYYGLSDVDGLVYTWTDVSRANASVPGQMLPVYRGGAWVYNELNAGAAFRNSGNGAGVNDGQFQYWGFRVGTVAVVPEPSSLALAAGAGIVVAIATARRRSVGRSG
jgi:sulfatase modifying factor 1